MASEIQMRLTGAFQAAVERYATDKEVDDDTEDVQDKDGKLSLTLLFRLDELNSRFLARESYLRNPVSTARGCFRRCYTMWCARLGSLPGTSWALWKVWGYLRRRRQEASGCFEGRGDL